MEDIEKMPYVLKNRNPRYITQNTLRKLTVKVKTRLDVIQKRRNTTSQF